MMEIQTTLRCFDNDAQTSLLHIRPCLLFSGLCQLFKGTKVELIRSDEYRQNAGPNKEPDPKSELQLFKATFKDGERVTIRATGASEELAVTLLQSAWENIYLYNKHQQEELYSLLKRAISNVVDPNKQEILLAVQQNLISSPQQNLISSPQEVTGVAVLNDRLHFVTAGIIPKVTKYFDTKVTLSYESANGVIQNRNTEPEGQFIRSVLDDSPNRGTKVTLRASGPKSKEVVESLRGVLEHLREIDEWIRKGQYSLDDRRTIEGTLDIAQKSPTARALPQEPGVDIYRILTPQQVLLRQGPVSKEDALKELSDLLSPLISEDSVTILNAIMAREGIEPTLFHENNGIAIPHGRLEKVPRISLAMGVYRDGIHWCHKENAQMDMAKLVLLCITPVDAPNTYLDFLKKVAFLCLKYPEFVKHIVHCDSAENVINLLTRLELHLDRIGSTQREGGRE